jgi:hypothetical protein
MAHLKDALALDVVDVRVHRTKTRAPNWLKFWSIL